MNIIIRVTLVIGFAVAAITVASAQSTGFYRVVSTQQTHIVSIDTAGLLVWSNTTPNAPGQVERGGTPNGSWTNDFPRSPIRANGSLSQARVPMHNVLQSWIVAFQPSVTLEQAEALFDANKLIWQPLAWNSLRTAVIYVPQGESIAAVQNNPSVRYVEPDSVLVLY